jgi:hypothetical protein
MKNWEILVYGSGTGIFRDLPGRTEKNYEQSDWGQPLREMSTRSLPGG